MDDRPFGANLLRHAAGRLHGFPDISEDLLDAADEIERLRAERDAWKTAAMGAGTQAVRLREQIIEWAKSHQDDPRTAAEDALLSVAYGDYSPASGEPTP